MSLCLTDGDWLRDRLRKEMVGVATISILVDWSVWPLRIASVAVVLTNLEAVAITVVLPDWTPDVRTLAAALRIQKSSEHITDPQHQKDQ